MKKIAILGSTGSIGMQALEVISMHRDRFCVSVLAACKNIKLLQKQADDFQPQVIAVSDEEAGRVFQANYSGTAEVLIGKEALTEAVRRSSATMVLIAVVGTAGLVPTLTALQLGKQIALANKETLVAGGQLVTDLADRKQITILPVDSEHSAVFQCLLGQDHKGLHKIILTASGGPFRGKRREELVHVSPADCLRHPTWNMGQKVTMDSATMFNKGLEVIEAHWLFRTPYKDIDVVVQPQSLIHSMAEFNDGSIIAELGEPDMRVPIQFALTYPERLPSPSRSFLDWSCISSIEIEKPDTVLFRSLPLAYAAGKEGGDMTAVYNAANEEAVYAFLKEKIPFLSIFDTVEYVMNRWSVHTVREAEDIFRADSMARMLAQKYIGRRGL